MKFLIKITAIICLFIVSLEHVYSQQQIPPIPIDKQVRVGKLSNGLTYYIRYNNLPEHRADFYIAQKVGSILENDKQRGLAHFLEHMCFNGTKNFPEKSLITYLESIGVKFGQNLNAYTSIDETVYNISNVPVIRDGVIDSCLLILSDWANGLTLDNKEIDNERGVIHEEWRTRMNPFLRMYESVLPKLYPNSKYAYRMPIGTMDVVDNFPYEDLKAYYHKWYRPDLQGIIVVGDINVDDVEKKIQSTFSNFVIPENAAKREYFEVPDVNEPIVTIASDKEQTSTAIVVSYKYETTPDSLKTKMDYLFVGYLKSMMTQMMNDRFTEILHSSTSPFTYAQVEDGNYFISKTKSALTANLGSKENHINDAFKGFFTEIERVRRYGFTQGEYARAKANYLTDLESAYNERSKTKNGSYVSEYVQNFINGEPIPGIENEYAIMNQVVPNIPIEAVNSAIPELFSEKNIVISVFGPEKRGIIYPSKQEIIAIMNNTSKDSISVYVDKSPNEPLMAQAPVGGKVIKKGKGEYGSTILTLSNGVRVIIKPTYFKSDEIKMDAFSFGGTSLFPDSDIKEIKLLNDVIEQGGLGTFSNVELMKALAGKKVSLKTTVSETTENISGSSSIKDFETLMQLTYLSFQTPRKDIDAFNSFKSRLKTGLENIESKPTTALTDSLFKALYMNHPRSLRIKSDVTENLNYDKILEMYNDRFKDASDFTFIFVGNIDVEKDIAMIEKYLGSLPSTGRKEYFKDNKQDFRKGSYKNNFLKKQETPKSTVVLVYTGKVKYNLNNTILMSMFTQILDMVYLEEVREKESGTYGVGCGGNISVFPKERAILQISFDTNPEQREKLTKIIKKELNNFVNNGPDDIKLNKVKEYMLKSFKEHLNENGYWTKMISELYCNGKEMHKNYEETINKITVKDVKNFAKSLLEQNNVIEVSMSDL